MRRNSYLRIALCTNVFKGEPPKESLEMLDMDTEINRFVSDMMEKHKIEKRDDIELYLSDKTEENFVMITEENRDIIKEGQFLHLIRKPEVSAEDITKTLNLEKRTVEWNQALKELHTKFLKYPQFTTKFIEKKGHERLLDLLGSKKCSATVKTLCYQAGLFCNILMAVRILFKKYGLPGANDDNGMVSWALIDDNVVNELITGLKSGEVTFKSLECCYDLLDHCIQRLPSKADDIIKKLDAQMLFSRLSNEVSVESDSKRLPSKDFQLYLLNFLNTIFRHAKSKGNEVMKVSLLLPAEYWDVMLKCIPALRGEEDVQANDPVLGPLVEFQQHLLCQPAKKCKEALDPDDMITFDPPIQGKLELAVQCIGQSSARNRMNSLNMMRSLVQKEDVSSRLSNWKYSSIEIEHFKALGFDNPEQPYKDFDVSHGGVLAFECVSGFFKKYSSEAEELLSPKLNKGGGRFPFVRASGILVNILAKKFRMIGDLDNQYDPVNETDFFPMLCSKDNAFEQIFSKCIIAFARTWRDMRATDRDTDTVRKVVAEQLTQIFTHPQYRQRISALDAGLQKYNYAEILRLQQKQEEEKRKNKNISEKIRSCLRDKINKCIYDNRMNMMQKGTTFTLLESSFFPGTKAKAAGGANTTTLNLRLDRYMKHLYYEKSETGKADKNANTKAEDRLSTGSLGKLDEKEKISIANISEVNFRNKSAYQTVKKKRVINEDGQSGQQEQLHSCMTLIVEMPDENNRDDNKCVRDIQLMAPDINSFNIWLDGLNCLMKKEERSSLHERDFERLLSLEEKVRCLQLPAQHDVKNAPTIPPEPEDLP